MAVQDVLAKLGGQSGQDGGLATMFQLLNSNGGLPGIMSKLNQNGMSSSPGWGTGTTSPSPAPRCGRH
jgi:hypothetical protein